MHVLLLTAYFPPETGSASHLFYELGEALVKRGHRISVVTGFPSYHLGGGGSRRPRRYALTDRADVAGMNVFRVAVPQIARNTPVGRGLWQFSAAACFYGAGLKVPFDACLVYSPPLPLGLAALRLRRAGRLFVLNVQDLFPQSAVDLGLLRQPALVRLFESIERTLYHRADAVTVHSPGNRDHVLAHGGRPERTLVVHNPVDIGHITPGPKENELRRELGLDGRFVVSFAGIMGYSQDLDVVLQAARELAKVPDIRFLLVGDGVEKGRLVRMSHALGLKNVIWLPMQPRDQYPMVLHASDVGLATLRAQVTTPVVPSKILSIMAAGRPVIAAMDLRGDAPKLISEAQAGLCLAPEQPRALVDAILTLYRDREACDRLGANGRSYAEQELSTMAIAARYEQILGEIGKGNS